MGRKKKPDKMQVVCTKMPPSLIVALDRLARKLKGTRSGLVRAVLIDHVAKEKQLYD